MDEQAVEGPQDVVLLDPREVLRRVDAASELIRGALKLNMAPERLEAALANLEALRIAVLSASS